MDKLKKWTYVFNNVTPSMNTYLGKGTHWKKYHDDKSEIEMEVIIAVDKNNKPDVPLENAVVEIRYFFPDARKRDPSNYCGKFECDGLVLAGVIKDDDFQNIKLVLSATIDRKTPRTEITVIEGCGVYEP